MSEQKTYVSKNNLSYIRDKISSKVVKSDVIRKIVVVDEYPETEEEGVLYLKKQSSEPEPSLENLYYQDSDKEYTSSSGYSCNWRTSKTVEINSDTYLTEDKQRSSNIFTLNLKQNTTYKLVVTHADGSASKNTAEVGSVDFSLWNETTATKYINTTVNVGNDSEITFTATATETVNAEIQVYLYSGTHYTNVEYEIALYEVT